jgi:hypothetical protein
MDLGWGVSVRESGGRPRFCGGVQRFERGVSSTDDASELLRRLSALSTLVEEGDALTQDDDLELL